MVGTVRRRAALAAFAVIGTMIVAAPARATEPAADGAVEPPATHVLAKLQPWVTRELSPAQRPVTDRWVELPLAAGESPQAAAARWAAHPDVSAAEPNLRLHIEPGGQALAGEEGAAGADPLAAYQWHMPMVQATAALATTDGSGVTVAVLDTGISLEGEDLACHTLVHPYDAISRIAGPVADTNGHGTHIAGTVAQCTANGVGVTGVAPGAALMPVRVLDDFGGGDYADVAVGIDWARTHGADVINLSLGGACQAPWPTCSSQAVSEAIDRALAEEIVIVAASGNRSASWVDFPANHPGVIAVGALDSDQTPAVYGNGGSALGLTAPGGDTGVDRNGDGLADGIVQETFGSSGWGYWAWAGTSYATPHVTGAAALVRSAVPGATASEVRAALQCTALDLGPAGHDRQHGYGLVQAADAVAGLISGSYDTIAPSWPTSAEALVVVDAAGLATLSWPAAVDCDRVDAYRIVLDGAVVAEVEATVTSHTIPGAGSEYAVVAVDPAGNSAAAPAVRVLGAPVEAPGDQAGLVDPATGIWHLPGRTGGLSVFYFGDPGDRPFAGDWDCDGVDTPGLYRQSDGYVYLRNSNDGGIADISFYFGDPGDVPLAGDFDGDGCDTVSVYRPGETRVYVMNRLGSGAAGLGAADHFFTLGDPGDVAFVGDFDGDGDDEVGVYRPATATVHLRHELSPGPAHASFGLGDAGDLPIVGDWDGNGTDDVGIFRPADGSLHLGSAAELWGEGGWRPVAGRF